MAVGDDFESGGVSWEACACCTSHYPQPHTSPLPHGPGSGSPLVARHLAQHVLGLLAPLLEVHLPGHGLAAAGVRGRCAAVGEQQHRAEPNVLAKHLGDGAQHLQ